MIIRWMRRHRLWSVGILSIALIIPASAMGAVAGFILSSFLVASWLYTRVTEDVSLPMPRGRDKIYDSRLLEREGG